MFSRLHFLVFLVVFSPAADAPVVFSSAGKTNIEFWNQEVEKLEVGIEDKIRLREKFSERISSHLEAIYDMDTSASIDKLQESAVKLAQRSGSALASSVSDKAKRQRYPSKETLRKVLKAGGAFRELVINEMKIGNEDTDLRNQYHDSIDRMSNRVDQLDREIRRLEEALDTINGVLQGPLSDATEMLKNSVVALDSETRRVLEARAIQIEARQPEVARLMEKREESLRLQALEAARQRMWDSISGSPTLGSPLVSSNGGGFVFGSDRFGNPGARAFDFGATCSGYVLCSTFMD